MGSCGVDSDRFRLEGRLRNLNQGEFWVYSPDEIIAGIDTIKVREGRFSYEVELSDPGILVVIFPNYSELPVFAEPGEEADIKGSANNLKEISIRGTDDNNDMTDLRMDLNQLMPPEVQPAVCDYIEAHPESFICTYLLQRYVLSAQQPDYLRAKKLCALLQEKQPENGLIIKWSKVLERMANGTPKSTLKAFSAKDVHGRSVTKSDLSAPVNVVSVWASWNYQSLDMQRRLQKQKKTYGDKLAVLGICLDGRAADCRQRVDRDSLTWKTVCDGLMWESPLLNTFGINEVPGNIVVDKQGVVIDRDLDPQKLEQRIDNLLKK